MINWKRVCDEATTCPCPTGKGICQSVKFPQVTYYKHRLALIECLIPRVGMRDAYELTDKYMRRIRPATMAGCGIDLRQSAYNPM